MAAIERMRAMRRDGATLRAIGDATGRDAKAVLRILARAK
jgi:hypothetical protein